MLGAVLTTAVLAAVAAERADYLVVENPGALSILDEFEQPLNADERRELPTGAPFRIVKERTLLGDRITEATACSYLGRPYYLLLDEGGGLLGRERAGRHSVYRGAAVLGDTVEVSRDKGVSVAQRYPLGGERTPLAGGDLVVKVFAYQDAFYVRILERSPWYGWCSAGAASAWRKPGRAEGERAVELDAALIERIAGRFEAANDSYQKFFAHFNEVTGLRHRPPHWAREMRGSTVRFVLSELPGDAGSMRRSTAVLAGEVRALVLGKPFAVAADDGSVTVKPARSGERQP